MHPITSTGTKSEQKFGKREKRKGKMGKGPLEWLFKPVKLLLKSPKLQCFQKEDNLREIIHIPKTKAAKHWATHYSTSDCTKRPISLTTFHTTIYVKGVWQRILVPKYIKTISCNHRIKEAQRTSEQLCGSTPYSKHSQLETTSLNVLTNASTYFWSNKYMFVIQLLFLYSFAC